MPFDNYPFNPNFPGEQKITGMSIPQLLDQERRSSVTTPPLTSARKTSSQLRKEAERTLDVAYAIEKLERAKSLVEQADKQVKHLQEQAPLSVDEIKAIAQAGIELNEVHDSLKNRLLEVVKKRVADMGNAFGSGFAAFSRSLR